MLKDRMDYLAERQDVLSRSVANMDTPGFEMTDLKPQRMNPSGKPTIQGIKVVTTSPMHIEGAGVGGATRYKAAETKRTFETKPMENNVSLEEAMMKISDNSMEYQQAVNMYGKTSQLFKLALSNRG